MPASQYIKPVNRFEDAPRGKFNRTEYFHGLLDSDLIEALDNQVERCGKSRSAWVRIALREFFNLPSI